jgi:hypothetical protein
MRNSKKTANRPALILLSLIIPAATLQADPAILLGAGAATLAGAITKGSAAERAGVAGAAALTGALIGRHLEKKQNQHDLELYMLGRYQEAYIHAFSNWYSATLDPNTGRPPAFDGYWAMDIGLPDQTAIILTPPTRTAPVNREDYQTETQVTRTTNKKPKPNVARPADAIITQARERTFNGVHYTTKEVIYPRLPALR